MPKARDRGEQLRRAKRAQRERERARGLRPVQLILPTVTARKLRLAARDPRFPERLDRFLDEALVRIADYPALKDIAWNVAVDYLPARDAFGLYERNWRFVERERLSAHEKRLIRRLADRFGNGVVLG